MLSSLLISLKKGRKIDLEGEEVKSIRLNKVKDIDCDSLDDLLLDSEAFSQRILDSSAEELLSIYKCWRENDEFWERTQTDFGGDTPDPRAIEVLRLISVVYELNVDSGLAYTSSLYLQGALDITLDELIAIAKKNIHNIDILRVVFEVYTIKRSQYKQQESSDENEAIRAMSLLEPPEVVWKSFHV